MARSIHPSEHVPRWAHAVRITWGVIAILLFQLPGEAQTTITAEPRWSTYHGGIGDDQVLSIATDAFGHVYVAGRTTAGLLLGNDTTGQSGLTHQESYGGGASDAFLAKIAPQGSVLWCTYFGGLGDDEAVAVVVTGMEGVFLVGNTTSEEAIATDTLAHQSTWGGGSDMFVARFTEYGLLVGATYFGGADDEVASSAALDVHGRLLVAGSTTGAGSLGTLQPQQAYTAGMDGLLLLFSSTGSLTYGTFLGGEGDDAVVRVAVGDSTGAIVAGNTTSLTNIATDMALSDALQGGTDGFLMKVDTSLVLLQGTYFGGFDEDFIHGLAFRDSSIVICGLTYSDSLYTDPTSYQPANAGGGDGFMAVLNSALELQWCTFFGDTAYDALMAVDIDLAGRTYAAGITASDSSIASVDGLLQGATDGFVLRFNEPQDLAWSRYVGALGEDEAHAFRIKGNTSIFLGGRTSSTEDFAVAGHQMNFGGGLWDGMAIRMDQVESTICEGICTGGPGYGGSSGSFNGVSPPLTHFDVCLGQSVTFIAYGGALGAGATWMWYADECGMPEHFLTSGDTITITPTASFVLSVRAESLHHTTPCKFLPIVVHTYPDPLVSASDSACAGAPILLEGSGADAFSWLVGDTIVTGATAQAPAPLEAGTLMVEVTATNGPGCSVSATLPVVVLPTPATVWQLSDVTCHGGADGMIALTSPSATEVQILWTNTALEGAVLMDLAPGLYVATVTDSFGCSRTDSLWITMPVALMDSISATPALCGGPFGAAFVHSASSSPGLSFSLDSVALSGVLVEGLVPGTYTVYATDSAGCQEQMSFSIASIGTIAVSIPDTVVAENGSALLYAYAFPSDSLTTYLWTPATGLSTPDSASTECLVSDTAVYVITVTSGMGCTATDSVVVVPFFPPVIVVPDPCGEAFLPDQFSPNGDGLNDTFCALGGCYTALSLMIYDRWGQRVFSSSDPEVCWDGQLNGAQLPAGVYAFTFSAERSTGEAVERKGTITLRR